VAVAPADYGTSVKVTSISGLKKALADNTVDTIIVANGTYHVSPSNQQVASDSLWIGSQGVGGFAFAERTRPVTVRAETIGGVTFDGGGGSGYGGLSFEAGAHDQTWDGFNFANMVGSQTGVIEFGGYDPTGRAGPYNITLRHISIRNSCHRASSSSNQEHAVYFAHAATRPHDILLEDIAIDGTDSLSLWGGIHAYHGDATNPPADHVTVRRLTTTGLNYPIIMWWDGSGANAHDWTFDGATIVNAKEHAVGFYSAPTNATNIQLKDIVSTGSPSGAGFYSMQGASPSGVTFINDSLR
jgi:hypothetical protein